MQNKVFYGKYVVILMDLLGQKEMYKTLEGFKYPMGDQESEFTEKLTQFIRMIEYFKRDVDSFLDAVNEYEPQIKHPSHVQQFVTKTTTDICKVQRFSDGIMVFVPLGNTDDSFPISSVYTALLCATSTMLNSLAKGNPIRAGIGIGGGAEIDEGELFGPAIGYAHEMESKRAIYPRIAIHEKLIEYFESHDHLKNAKEEDIESNFIYQMSQLCKSLIKLDNDGEYILDYLNDAAWGLISQDGQDTLLKHAFNFIQTEKQRFEKENNQKLTDKYAYLHEYFVTNRNDVLKHA